MIDVYHHYFFIIFATMVLFCYMKSPDIHFIHFIGKFEFASRVVFSTWFPLPCR